MRTRIEHATVVTCQGSEAVVLRDAAITFADGVITQVGPSDGRSGPSRGPVRTDWTRLRGKSFGRILIEIGCLTTEQVNEALEIQRQRHGVIGHTLVELGYITEAQVDWALHAQAGRDPGPLPVDILDEIINGRGMLIVPGLINTHHHLYQSLTRCVPAVQNAGLFDWLAELYGRWQHVDFASVHQAAMISLAELAVNGCTTTVDHMYLFPPASEVTLEAVLEAAEKIGLRIHACRGSMTLGQSSGGLPPDCCVESDDRVLADYERVVRQYHDAQPHAMQRIDLAPCAPFNITPDLLVATRDFARANGLLLHTHIAETLDEQRFCLEQFGVRPLEFLQRHDWLGADVYLAHCVHLNEAEIGLLAQTHTSVAHCPSSNMRLGSGIAPIRAMLEAGVNVALGVDGSSSNDGGSVLAEAKQAMYLQRAIGGASAVSPAQTFRMATAGGADLLHRPELGRIVAGSAADLVIYDAADIAFAGAIFHDPLGALLLCQAPRPRQVIVAGRTVVRNGEFTTIDLPKLIADFNQFVARFT